MPNKHKTTNIKDQPTKKKIGFFSAILLVIGSSIGAGIFFKNHEILKNVQGSIILSLVSWFIAIIGVLAMGFTLAELCSGSGDNNSQGIIGWVKTFNSKYLYRACKNFMAYLYLPLNFFVMPYYALQSLGDGLGWHPDWWVLALISFAIMTWFVIVSGLSAHAANVQNWIITCVKFLPLAFAIIIGFVLVAIYGSSNTAWISDNQNTYPSTDTPLFSQLTPVLGIFLSIPAIFFAFDGFYSTAGIQSEMKEPRKVSLAMTLGLAIVSFLNVMISLSLLLCSSDGTIAGISWLNSDALHWLLIVINVLISFGVLGVINGFAIFNARFYEDLIKTNEIVGWKIFYNKVHSSSRPIAGTIYSYVLCVIFFVLFTTIGIFYFNIGEYDEGGPMVNGLYSFVDLVANWTSLFAFGCIVLATVGALRNRRTKKIKTGNMAHFKTFGYISVCIVVVGFLFIFASTFGNLILTSMYTAQGIGMGDDKVGYSWSETITKLIGSILTVVTLVIFLATMFIPASVMAKVDCTQVANRRLHRIRK